VPISSRRTVSVAVRCDAPRSRGCHGTLALGRYSDDFGIGSAPLSIEGGRTTEVEVPVPAGAQRAIARRRRVTFRAVARIGAPEGRSLVSARLVRVDSARAAPAPTCRTGGVRTIRRTARLRIYTVRTPIDGEVYETTVACLFAAGRQVRLDEPEVVEADEPFRLVGSLLAYKYEFLADGPSDATTFVRVVDLRTGRQRYRLCALGPGSCGEDGASAELRVLVMLPSGGAAWTATVGPDCFVVKADAGHAPRILDEAEGRIHAGSLQLSGNRLTWKHGSKTRSATLH
jgi:hypothetical protein